MRRPVTAESLRVATMPCGQVLTVEAHADRTVLDHIEQLVQRGTELLLDRCDLHSVHLGPSELCLDPTQEGVQRGAKVVQFRRYSSVSVGGGSRGRSPGPGNMRDAASLGLKRCDARWESLAHLRVRAADSYGQFGKQRCRECIIAGAPTALRNWSSSGLSVWCMEIIEGAEVIHGLRGPGGLVIGVGGQAGDRAGEDIQGMS